MSGGPGAGVAPRAAPSLAAGLAALLAAFAPARVAAADFRLCGPALVLSTGLSSTRHAPGWQLAEHVDERAHAAWRAREGTGTLPIYGVPVGADFAAFRRNVAEARRAAGVGGGGSAPALSAEVAANLATTALGGHPAEPYRACLFPLLSGPGLHLSVLRASEGEATLEVRYVPPAIGAPRAVAVRWAGASPAPGEAALPDRVGTGGTPVRVRRPAERTEVRVEVADPAALATSPAAPPPPLGVPPTGGTVFRPALSAAAVVLTPLPAPPDPRPCGGVENARAPFAVTGDPRGAEGFAVEVPDCGYFALTATVGAYAPDGRGGLTELRPPAPQRFEVRRRLAVEPVEGRGGRVLVDEDRRPPAEARFVFLAPRGEGPSRFGAVAPDWPRLLAEIEAANRRHAAR